MPEITLIINLSGFSASVKSSEELVYLLSRTLYGWHIEIDALNIDSQISGTENNELRTKQFSLRNYRLFINFQEIEGF